MVVELDGEILAETDGALRVLETSHPPVFYLPPGDVRLDRLVPSRDRSVCEFKGTASYFDVPDRPGSPGRRAVAWTYPDPRPGYEALTGYVAFYPGRVDRATVDGEAVVAQPGDFYGGWVTSAVTGPFKGGPGTMGW